ncbi:MAG TPA: N-acetyltransferase [Candidatus Aquilonibacter sp.]|nr:N-acetyltransferase [Candidatus Aquilonibacter sp.]
MKWREYRSEDLGAIFALDQICFEPPFRFSKNMMRRFAEARNALTVVAESESGMISAFGIAHVERSWAMSSAYVVTLDVEPGQRRRGLASETMQRMEQRACEAGCRAMVLHVSVENEGAIEFYERRRYVRRQMAKGFYGPGRDAYVYSKPLEDQSDADEESGGS